MLKDVFHTSGGPQGVQYSTPTLLGWLTDSTREGLEAKYAQRVSKIEKILGRPPTEKEIREGVPKPPLTAEQERESRQARIRADRAKRLADEAAHSPEIARLETARQRAEEERVAALSPIQRELELAEAAAKEAEQRKADQQRRAEIKATPAYQTLHQGINDSILVAKLDPSISQEQLDALVNQSKALERTADVTTIRANVAVIQRSISEQTAIQDAELQQAVSRAELRKRMLSSASVFDAVDVELVGSLPFVVLQSGGKTMKVTQERYDNRKSDESLRSELFGGGETNV